MQVRAFRRAGVPYLAENRPGFHGVADLHRETAGVQMLVEREDIRGDFEYHMITAVVFLRFREHQQERSFVGHAVVGRDYGPISHCEGVLPESIVLLDRLAIPGIDLVVLCPVPVDSEEIGRAHV